MIQSRHLLSQFSQTRRPVLVLAALLAGCDDQAGRQVLEPDGAFRLVDVLASWTARSKRIDLAFLKKAILGLW